MPSIGTALGAETERLLGSGVVIRVVVSTVSEGVEGEFGIECAEAGVGVGSQEGMKQYPSGISTRTKAWLNLQCITLCLWERLALGYIAGAFTSIARIAE